MHSVFDSWRGRVPGKALPAGKKQKKSIQSSTGHKKKVLVMDDDPFIRSVMRSLLRDLRYDVRLVRDGVEAIEYFKEAGALGDPFDAVILDLHVTPGMGGEKALEKLRDVDPEIKAILLTADICHPAVSDYETLGFKSAIIKPFLRNDLQLALDRAFGTMSDGPGENS
jgi:two-component system cell cycle sensor histidine kinase/response regulator CckA